MKCKKCGAKASVNMRQHKLALCKEHYLEWVPEQTERFIKKYECLRHHEKVLVAVSGGKDSLGLWDILCGLVTRRMDFISVWESTAGSTTRTNRSGSHRSLPDEHDLKLHVVDIEKEYGQPIPVLCGDFAPRIWQAVCRVRTGKAPRDEPDRPGPWAMMCLRLAITLTMRLPYSLAIHFNWSSDYLLRQGPVLPSSDGLARKVKPLCRFYEREMTAYCLLRGIEYIYEECPFAEGSQSIYYKELLNQLETTRPGAKLTFYLRFLEARKSGNLFIEQNTGRAHLHDCPKCGQPTSTDDLCSFCRMIEKANAVSAG